MLEYFAFKKYKKNKAEKETAKEDTASVASAAQQHSSPPGSETPSRRTSHTGPDRHGAHLAQPHLSRQGTSASVRATRPVLGADDERFLETILSERGDDGPAPPLPPRIPDWSPTGDAASPLPSPLTESPTSPVAPAQTKTAEKKPNRLSALFSRSNTVKHKEVAPQENVPVPEGEREAKDLSRVLDRLNLTAKNNVVVGATSSETAAALQKFTLVFKDLVNGVPTAYDDLVGLFQDRDGALNKGFDKLPDSLKKLVTQLPEKLTASLGPEILAAAAKSQGLEHAKGASAKGTLEKMFLPQNIMELVTKPGALVSMLRAIVEALKTRWPAFIGMNVIWSVALSLLMLMLWYCYKRGREERLLKEKDAETPIDGSDRIEELPDDPMLPAPDDRRGGPSRSQTGSLARDSRAPAPLSKKSRSKTDRI